MAIQLVGLLTIANGASDSDEMSSVAFGACKTLSIAGPAAETAACVLQSGLADATGTTFNTVQSPAGTDVTIAAAKCVVLTAKAFPRIRIHSAGVEGAQRIFTVWGDVSS